MGGFTVSQLPVFLLSITENGRFFECSLLSPFCALYLPNVIVQQKISTPWTAFTATALPSKKRIHYYIIRKEEKDLS